MPCLTVSEYRPIVTERNKNGWVKYSCPVFHLFKIELDGLEFMLHSTAMSTSSLHGGEDPRCPSKRFLFFVTIGHQGRTTNLP